GIHHVGITGNTRQRLFNPFHFTNRDFELTADLRVSPNPHRNRFQAAGRVRRQRNAATDRQTFHQHTPALTCHAWAADDVINRYEDIFTTRWTVLEGHVQRDVTTPNLH